MLIQLMARRIKGGSPDCALVVGSIVRTLCAASANASPGNRTTSSSCPAARTSAQFSVLPQPMPHLETGQHSACVLAAKVAIRFHCADSPDTPSENRTTSSPCPAARTSARFSVLLQPTTAAKPDSAQLMPSAASGISTAILCHFSPGAWPVFSLPGIAIHQQFVIYGIFYTELRFSRAGYWSIWA